MTHCHRLVLGWCSRGAEGLPGIASRLLRKGHARHWSLVRRIPEAI
jgi:hypothetical protein